MQNERKGCPSFWSATERASVYFSCYPPSLHVHHSAAGPICSALGGSLSYDILFGFCLLSSTHECESGRTLSFVFDEQTDLEYLCKWAHLRGVRVRV